MILSQSNPEYAEGIVQSVRSFLKKAQRDKLQFTSEWGTWIRYYEGKHWRREDDRRRKMTLNYTKAIINNAVALLLDNRPMPQVVPGEGEGPEIEPISAAMQALLKTELEEQGFECVLEESLIWAKVLTRGLVKSGYDVVKDKIYNVCVQPQNILVDPYCRKVGEAQYVVHCYTRPIDELIKEYPEKAGGLRPNVEMQEYLNHVKVAEEDDIQIIYDPAKAWPAGTREGDMSVPEDYYGSDRVWVFEIWTHDAIDYPNWRLTIFTCGKVLKDTHNPFEHGENPFSDYANALWPVYWNLSDVDMLLSIQRALNKHETMVASTFQDMGNPKILYEENSMDESTLTNVPGAIIPYRQGFKPPIFEAGTGAPQSAFVYTQSLIGHLNFLTSMYDALRGKSGGGARAWGAIESLQDAAMTTIRMQLNRLVEMIQRIGKLTLSNIGQFYTKPFQFRTYADDGSVIFMNYVPAFSQYKHRVFIEAAPRLPMSTTGRGQQSMQLFAMHAIDRPALLKALAFPGRGEVDGRMKQGEMMQQMVGGPPPRQAQRPASSASIKGGKSNLPLMESRRSGIPYQVGI